ncbi:MAG: hypothetical protein LBM96_05755 [Methanobrevibacter sp.]|nr:hypothetical protein [Candidatus Methanoflexus mossambicus]
MKRIKETFINRNRNTFSILIFCFILISIFLAIGSVSAHGADVTDNIMVVTDDSNAIETKALVDELGLSMKVYKFNAVSDVEHILEHATTNPNKQILVLAFQNSSREYIKSNYNWTDKVMVVDVENEEDIKNALIDFNTSISGANNSVEGNLNIDYTTLILVVIIVALLSVIGTYLLKSKKK